MMLWHFYDVDQKDYNVDQKDYNMDEKEKE